VTSTGLHEPEHLLSASTIDQHRGYRSLIEELEAIDWYAQRTEAARDPELARVLAHARDEEKEHAVLTLEWLRRQDEVLDAQLRRVLFSDAPLPLPEGPDPTPGDGEAHGAPRGDDVAGRRGLGVGDLRGAANVGGI
jgi:hypothetical protein